jgi:hypothetical protein
MDVGELPLSTAGGSALATPRETAACRQAPRGAAREPCRRACLPRLAALLVA